MNAKKVNNLIIIFLLMLNIVLFSLILMEDNKYYLTSRQEKAIITLLANSKIDLDAALIKRFKPMKLLELSAIPDQNSAIVKILFENPEKAKRREEFGKIIFEDGSRTLSFEKSSFLFEDPGGKAVFDNGNTFDEKSARNLTEAYVKKFNSSFKGINLSFDVMRPIFDGYYAIEYRTVYNSYKVYSSYLRFRVSDKGIIQMRGNFLLPESFSSEKAIFSPDEALFSLMQDIRNIYGTGTPISIIKMDIVFRLEDTEPAIDTKLKSTPYYRFYIAGRNEPFLVDAYTNIIK